MTKKSECFTDRIIVGFVEPVKLKHNGTSKEFLARIDTGATKSSIDLALASTLKLGPVVASKIIKSANGAKLRPVVEATVVIQDKEVTDTFTLADRGHMQYKVLIGQNILQRGFLIDPEKK